MHTSSHYLKIMKAVGYRQSLPSEHPESLIDFVAAEPTASANDVLVEVKAVAVNPVDTKMRMRSVPTAGETKILGWDAAGIVKSVGSAVTLFKPGDRVWYAGSIARAGCNSEFHVVDERIVGHMPTSLDFAQAAALPLTSITAWELLFDRLGIALDQTDRGESLLVIGAAGGVGSILIQLARQLTGLKVIGTASREATREWVRSLGAHEVIDHTKPLADELKRIGHPAVTHVASLTQTDQHFMQIVEALAPQGKLALIDDPKPIDVMQLKRKSLSLHWELMFTRSLFATPDMIEQHRLLSKVASLVDQGFVRTTMGEQFGVINAANLRRAHAFLETGRAQGKIVLEGL